MAAVSQESLEAALAQATGSNTGSKTELVQRKMLAARKELASQLVERDEEVETLFNALLAGEHILFVGPPGTAKSMTVDFFTHMFDGADMFHILLTKFSTMEEVFGPIDLSGLKEVPSRYERVTSGYLPTAHVAVVDEIWKASSAIINTLLNVMQERVFKNGVNRVRCPLMLMVGASNEWPLGDGKQELGAAFDRFLIRKEIKYVRPGSRRRLCFGDAPQLPTAKITLDELDHAQSIVSSIPFTSAAEDAFDEISMKLHAEGIHPGDRRLRKSISVCRAAAFMDQSSVVEPVHLECLQHILWEDPKEQAPKATEIVCKIANPTGAEITNLMASAMEIIGKIGPSPVVTPEIFTGIKKLGEIRKDLGKFDNRRAKEAAEFIQGELTRVQKKMMNVKD